MNSRPSFFSKVVNHRFIKFAVVGASGIPVNLVMLYVGREYLFARVSHQFHGFDLRLNLALVFSILCSIVNNFAWNHQWTWGDRKRADKWGGLQSRFGRYLVASWVGVAIQLALTNLLTRSGLYYLVANLVAIGVASFVNFMLSDKWAFRSR